MIRSGIRFTSVEFEFMKVIWRADALTVADVQDSLLRELAYTSVQTTLNIMVRKGHLKRQRRGRGFIYRAMISEQEYKEGAIRAMIANVFDGSVEELSRLILTFQTRPKSKGAGSSLKVRS